MKHNQSPANGLSALLAKSPAALTPQEVADAKLFAQFQAAVNMVRTFCIGHDFADYAYALMQVLQSNGEELPRGIGKVLRDSADELEVADLTAFSTNAFIYKIKFEVKRFK